MLCERTEPVCRARLSGVTTKIPEALILQVPSRVPPQRVSVVGVAGSGKTTFSGRLSAALALPLVELDGIFHQPGWTPSAPDTWLRSLAQS